MPVKKSIRTDFSAATFLSSGEQERLAAIFQRALINTDKQLIMKDDGTAYVKTGDIAAEWLRDSSAQVRPYLFFAKENKSAAAKLKAVIERQALYIAVDPYANAFREDFVACETKFELDSLSYPILLAWTYWKVTGDATVFTPAVKAGFDRALETMEIEQDHDGQLPGRVKSRYKRSGKNPVGYTGMIWSAFRPSDDACKYNFLIPSQMQAVQALTALREMETFLGCEDRAARAGKLGAEVNAGIEKFGIVEHPKYGRIYAYEVDGLGHANLMDDANIPSLLSIPYFGYASETDKIYATTRRFVLSDDNPYFYSGRFQGQDIFGVGSSHSPTGKIYSLARWALDLTTKNRADQAAMLKTALPGHGAHGSNGMIWPLAQLAQGLTTKDRAEHEKILKMLLASDSGDHSLHESYLSDNPLVYTRKDFGWPNALFAEFVLTVLQGRPALPVPAPPQKLPLSAMKPVPQKDKRQKRTGGF